MSNLSNPLSNPIKDSLKWQGALKLFKFDSDDQAELWKAGKAEPIEVIEGKNVALNAGITEVLDLICGVGGHAAFNAANTQLGIGDSSTAAVATQTGLQASTNTYFQTIDSAPTISGQSVMFQATIGTGNANYHWAEIVVRNSSSGVTLNRIVVDMGTKTSASVYVGQVTITLS